MENVEIKIFYSWQSDLPNNTTRGLIQSSINAVVKALRNTIEIVADRDTRGIYGSPDIVETIFSKIDDCDVFIADVSGVTTYHPLNNNGGFEKRLKMAPNPNVLLELGYATQVVGWENIICIMNEDYTEGSEIPFDIEHHRLTRYSLKNREKADVRKELKDIISGTVLNVMENGKRVRPNFSNIIIGSWNQNKKDVEKCLIPYDVYEAGPAKNSLDKLFDTAKLLIDNIQETKVRKNVENPQIEVVKKESNVRKEKTVTLGGTELIPVQNRSILNLDRWNLVEIRTKERSEIREDIKTYFNICVDEDFFDFGGLKYKNNLIPGNGNDYDGTEGEVQKYYDYVELKYVMAKIEMLETYRKTFDDFILLPLVAKNESSVSDSDINISIQIDNTTAEIVYPTSELICDELKGMEGIVYEEGLVELVLAQNETVDIKNSIDTRFWSVEDQQRKVQAMPHGGINGAPEYTMEDYVNELSRYVAYPKDGSETDLSFFIPSLHAKEVKWLSHLIILKPLRNKIRIKYYVKSRSSDGNLKGSLEMLV